MHASLAAENITTMSGNHSNKDENAADHDKRENGLDEIERPIEETVKDISRKLIEGDSGGIIVVGVHGE